MQYENAKDLMRCYVFYSNVEQFHRLYYIFLSGLNETREIPYNVISYEIFSSY